MRGLRDDDGRPGDESAARSAGPGPPFVWHAGAWAEPPGAPNGPARGEVRARAGLEQGTRPLTGSPADNVVENWPEQQTSDPPRPGAFRSASLYACRPSTARLP